MQAARFAVQQYLRSSAIEACDLRKEWHLGKPVPGAYREQAIRRHADDRLHARIAQQRVEKGGGEAGTAALNVLIIFLEVPGPDCSALSNRKPAKNKRHELAHGPSKKAELAPSLFLRSYV
jgi:hypothetical protein